GMAGDRAGLLDAGLDRARVEVRRARAALALAEVHGDRQTAVAAVFQRLHVAQAHADIEAEFLADADLDGIRAALSTAVQHLARALRQRSGIQIRRVTDHGDLIRLLAHLTYPCLSRSAPKRPKPLIDL